MAGNLTKLQSNKTLILGHLGALLCVTMWGVSFVSTKVLLNYEMQPVEIYIYRFTIAYLLILAINHKRFFSNNWRDEGLLLMCGLLSGSIYFLAENFALRYTLVTNVSLLTSLSPLITAMIVGVMYKSERPGAGMWMGSMVAFLGVACVIFNSSFNLEINPLGDILSLAAAFSWSLYSLVLKRLNANYDIWFITRKTFFYGVLTSLPFIMVEPPKYNVMEVLTTGPLLFNVLFLAVGSSLIAFVLWAETVKKVGALKANNYMYLQTVITMAFSAAFLGEKVSIVGIGGCILILLGLWLGDYLTRRKKMKS